MKDLISSTYAKILIPLLRNSKNVYKGLFFFLYLLKITYLVQSYNNDNITHLIYLLFNKTSMKLAIISTILLGAVPTLAGTRAWCNNMSAEAVEVQCNRWGIEIVCLVLTNILPIRN